ncbi:MAG TPA: HAD-IA family hydrolase [Verrucomicrobiae bacterium]|nr:HAD-IA family hydrolase [Verrucomicrobiae bacterium]
MKISRIQAVTFDAGGTLFAPWPSVGHVYAEVAEQFGVEGVAPAALNDGFGRAWRTRKDFNYSEAAWFELVRQSFGPRATELPEDFYPAVYRRFVEAEAWRIFEDVVPSLGRLASLGLRLGIVSNWDDRLGPLLANLKLASYFDAVLISCDVGFAKPSPVIFEQAARKLGVPPSAVLHVGDSAAEDFDGARAMGAQATLIDRDRESALPHRISSLADLEALVATS